jgi:hypothetical protein
MPFISSAFNEGHVLFVKNGLDLGSGKGEEDCKDYFVNQRPANFDDPFAD